MEHKRLEYPMRSGPPAQAASFKSVYRTFKVILQFPDSILRRHLTNWRLLPADGRIIRGGRPLMVNTIVDGTFRQTNLTKESPEYLARREELRLAEIELMRQPRARGCVATPSPARCCD